MKRFLIAAVAALTFGAPAMAQSYGGYGGQPYQAEAHARGFDGSAYEQYGRSYNRGPGNGFDDRGYNDRRYNDRGHNARAERREWREERQHERRERRERGGGNRYYGY